MSDWRTRAKPVGSQGWRERAEPVNKESDEEGGYEGFAKKAIPALKTVMEVPERYFAAPTRAAVDATLHKPFGFDAIPAYLKQVGEDPTKAPTSGRILNRLGINTPSIDIPTPFKKDLEGNNYSLNTKDMVEGAASAAMDPTMAFVPEIGPVARGAGRFAEGLVEEGSKKAARVLADIPEAATERYIRNPRAVNSASSQIMPHVERWNQMVGDLQNKIFQGSAESRAALEGKKFARKDISDVFDAIRDEVIRDSEGIIDPPTQRRLSAIDAMRNAYAPQPPKLVPSGFLNLDGTPGQRLVKSGPDVVSGNRVKNLVQELQRSSEFADRPGEFISVDSRDKNRIMGLLQEKLKNNPDYAEIMAGVADDMELLNRATSLGRTENALEGVFRNVGKTRENPINIIREVDQRLGTNFYDELLNTSAKRSFANTNANGTRRAFMGAAFTSPAAWALKDSNPVAAAIISTLGAAGGFVSDKYGGTMTKGAIGAANFIPKQARRIAESIGSRIPQDSRYLNILIDAANKSPKAFVVTHHLLMSSDPEYRKLFSDTTEGMNEDR